MLTQDESTPSVFIGGLRTLIVIIVIDFTIFRFVRGHYPPGSSVFVSSWAAEKVLGDIG